MLSVRVITTADVPLLMDYWFNSTDEHLVGMGADPSKMPRREDFTRGLLAQIALPIEQRGAYVVIWLQDGKPLAIPTSNRWFLANMPVCTSTSGKPTCAKKAAVRNWLK